MKVRLHRGILVGAVVVAVVAVVVVVAVVAVVVVVLVVAAVRGGGSRTTGRVFSVSFSVQSSTHRIFVTRS